MKNKAKLRNSIKERTYTNDDLNKKRRENRKYKDMLQERRKAEDKGKASLKVC